MKYGQLPGINKPISRLVQGTIMCNTKEQEKNNDSARQRLCSRVSIPLILPMFTVVANANAAWEPGSTAAACENEIVLIGKGAHLNQDRQRVTPFDISCRYPRLTCTFQN